MGTPVEAKRSAKAAYNAASDFYNHPVNTFWDRYGQQTVSRLQLEAGARVLDVCCGAGASAIPAARAAGPNGFVLGVDLAENLIELAKSKATELRLDNIEFRVADMLDLDLAPSAFDVVICVFGIFFVPDMQQAIRELWKLLRPAGRLAITTWGATLLRTCKAQRSGARCATSGPICSRGSIPGIEFRRQRRADIVFVDTRILALWSLNDEARSHVSADQSGSRSLSLLGSGFSEARSSSVDTAACSTRFWRTEGALRRALKLF